jgi:hypothetical protein
MSDLQAQLKVKQNPQSSFGPSDEKDQNTRVPESSLGSSNGEKQNLQVLQHQTSQNDIKIMEDTGHDVGLLWPASFLVSSVNRMRFT